MVTTDDHLAQMLSTPLPMTGIAWQMMRGLTGSGELIAALDSNPSDDQFIAQASNKALEARAIYEGIRDYILAIGSKS